MSTFNAQPYSQTRNFNLKGSSKIRGAMLRFGSTNTANLFGATENGLYVNNSNQLVFSSQGTTTIVGASGSGGTPTWETIFAADNTFSITPDATWTIAGNRSTATDVITVTNIGGGSGDCIKIQNSGSGKDISGTSDTWSFSKAGALISVGITPGGDITTTALAVDWDLLDNDSAALSFDSAGASGILAIDTSDNSEVVLFGKDLQVTDGIGTFISTSNTVSNILVTNNTITTFGANADSAGVVVIRSTSLTTGALLQLQYDESELAGGFLIVGRGTDDGSNDYTVGENGITVISGTAGSNSLTLTAGDLLLSDGSITVTDADNATSLSVTNDSAAANDMVTFISSGTTTGSLVRLTSTGTILTTGSVLEVVGDSATTSGAGGEGRGVVTISADALTTGTALDVTNTNIALTSGNLAHFSHISGNITGSLNKTTNQVEIESLRTVTTGTVSDNYDALSVIRTSVINGGGSFTSAGSVLYLENAITNTSGTVTDTATNGLEIVMDSLGSGDAINITHNATAGRLLDMTSSATSLDGVIQVTANSANTGNVIVVDANGLTSGTIMALETTGTVVTTGDVLSIVANSATTSTGLLRISATALTNGSAIEVTGGGSNYLTAGNLVDIVMGAATKGSGLVVTTSGAYDDAGVGVVEFTGNSATTGDILVLSATSQTTGNLILATGGGAALLSGGSVARFNMGAAIAGSGLEIVTTGVYVDATDGILNITANSATTGNIAIINATATTEGTLLELNATGGTMTTGNYLVCNDASLDVFAIRRNGHLFSSQTTKPTIVVSTQNGISAAAVTNGSTDTCGEITTTGTSSTGDTIITITFEEAYANAPRVFLMPTNEAAAQSADAATSGAYISATTTGTFVITIPGASGSTPSWDYWVMETTVA